MRIRGIEIDNFLSFHEFRWANVDRDLNIIVGPNGAGKTNLFQAARAMLDAVSNDALADQRRAFLSRALHRGDTTHVLRIAFDVEFDTSWEEGLLRTFIAAALSEGGGFGIPGQDGEHRLAAFWFEHLSKLNISFLLAGQLVLTYNPFGTWSLWYESTSSAFPFRWDLGSTDSGFSKKQSATTWQGSYSALQRSYSQQQREQLQAYAVGAEEYIQLPTPDMQRVLDGHNLRLEVQGNNVQWFRGHREFARLAGITPPYSVTVYNARFVFEQLLQRSLIYTDNVRRAPLCSATAAQLMSPSADISSGEQVPLYLIQQKLNAGDDVQYKTILETFHRLTGTRFDIGIQNSVSTFGQSESQAVPLDLIIDASWGKLPLMFSGAGRMEALFLSAVLANTQGKVVLLDEPAQNLHPNLQVNLMGEIRNNSHSQFLISTHSPVLIPPDAIDKVSRFYTLDGVTQQAAMDLHELVSEDRARLQKELRGSSDARALLFARGVMLVEGDTELGTLPVWQRKVFGRHLESDDLAIYSVGSGDHFAPYVRLLEGYHIPWVIVCDGAVIGDPGTKDRQRCRIASQLRKAGMNHVLDLDAFPFQARRAQLEQYGVFTVAASAEQGQEGFEESVPLLKTALVTMDGRSKARNARHVAEDNECPPEVTELLQKISEYLARHIGG